MKSAMKSLLDKNSKNGFTLVELAIALMVIGLLIGGVLKGQELIENARVTATIRDVKSYDAAVMIFRNTYGILPGDIRNPTRIPGCSQNLCNVAGNGNGSIGNTVTTEHEIYNFFPHLTKAGLIKGPEGGTQAQQEALAPYMGGLNQAPQDILSMPIFNDSFMLACMADSLDYQDQLNNLMPASGRINMGGDRGGDLGINWPTDSAEYKTFFPIVPIDGVGLSVNRFGRKGHAYHLRPVPVQLADQIDSKLDDGYANSGNITNGSALSRIGDADMATESGEGGLRRGEGGLRASSQTYSEASLGSELTDIYFTSAF